MSDCHIFGNKKWQQEVEKVTTNRTPEPEGPQSRSMQRKIALQKGEPMPTCVPATPESEGPAPEPQMSEPTHKLPESLPYQMMIGDLRRCLFTRGDSAWNGYIRDMTAELEQTGEYVNVAEAFYRINAKAAKMMEALEFQKAMPLPATPAPSQPAREWLERNYGDLNRLAWPQQVSQALLIELLETYAAQQTAAKEAEIADDLKRLEALTWACNEREKMQRAAERDAASLRAENATKEIGNLIDHWDMIANDTKDNLRELEEGFCRAMDELAAMKAGKEQ